MSVKLDKHKIAHACSFKTAVVLAVTKSCSVTQFAQVTFLNILGAASGGHWQAESFY